MIGQPKKNGGKRGKLAIRGGIRDISGARGGHFDARIELINKVKSDLSGIMHRLYVLCSSHNYIWNPWAFVPGFCPGLLSAFLRIPQGSADQDNNGKSKGK